MVVCPCGVMVPAPGLGRLRRASRGHGCFDPQSTVTTQPKEAQEPASIDKLAASTADPSSIPRPLSRTSKNNNNNKGAAGKPADDNVKGDHASRTTLALATTESGRYVGTRPLRSNRSPTPTLHRIPSKDQKNTTSNGRPSKHLPAVRTSPTSPQDNNNQDVSVSTRPAIRAKGPTALPRHNHVNQRMNELNVSNQRRLLRQNLSTDEKLLRSPTRFPSAKTDKEFGLNSMAPKTRIYENLTFAPRTERDEIVYENLRFPRRDIVAAAELPGADDVTDGDESSSADSVTSEPPGDSAESTLWLSESWKYNTIKKAPDFNIFEFSDIDSTEDGEKENEKEKKPGQGKERKPFRSRLPLFGRRSEKDNRSSVENAIKPSQPSGKAVKPDNKRTHKHPHGPKSPANVHRSKMPKPPTRTSSVAVGGARSRDASPFSSDSEGGACRSPARAESQRSAGGARPADPPSGPGSRRTSVASDTSSSLSPLASPSPSLRSLQENYQGRYPSASPSPSLRSLQEPERQNGSSGTPPSLSFRPLQKHRQGRSTPSSPNLSLWSLQEGRQSRSPSGSPSPSLRSLPECHQGTPTKDRRQRASPGRIQPGGEVHPRSQDRNMYMKSFSSTRHDRTDSRREESLERLPRVGDWSASSPGRGPRRQPILESDEDRQQTPPKRFDLEDGESHSPQQTLPHTSVAERTLCGSGAQRSYSRHVSRHDMRRRSLQAGALMPSPQHTVRNSQEHAGEQHILQDSSLIKNDKLHPVAASCDVTSSQPTISSKHCPPPWFQDEGERSSKDVPYQYQSLPQLHTATPSRSPRPLCWPHAPPSTPSLASAPATAPQPVYANCQRGKSSELSPAGRSLAAYPGGCWMNVSPSRVSVGPSRGRNYPTFPGDASAPQDSGRISAASPVLPPLPPGVLLEARASSPAGAQSTDVSPPEDKLNLASICILSLDLTVDCEEISDNGFPLVTVIENGRDDENDDNGTSTESSPPSRSEDEGERKDEGSDRTPVEADTGLGSSHSSSSNFDEKYYENDDYDTVDDGVCVAEELPDRGILSDHDDSPDSKASLANKIDKLISYDDDEDDFIETDCDVKPMETLKRPLVYGYGSGPVRSLRGSSFLEKRLSQASIVSEHMEFDLAESMLSSEVLAHSESCVSLKETYWDHYQATKERRSDRDGQNGMHQGKKTDPCPSTRFCYDPEVLLAQVRCPKSLEDATFRQYSAFMTSQIYDHFGNIHENLKEYGLTSRRLGWISSQPELPDAPRHEAPSEMSSLDYSSEPELTYCHEPRQAPGLLAQCHAARAHVPHPPPPPPSNSRNPPLDSDVWTYFHPSGSTSATCSSFGQHPVAMPRSTSSLSHVAPGGYNPWFHLLPNVTPPRTPRHSAYLDPSKGSATSSPSRSHPTSPTKLRNAVPPWTSSSEPRPSADEQRAPAASAVKPSPSPRRSFLPNFSKVVRSPLKKASHGLKADSGTEKETGLPAAAPHKSIQNRTFTATSSKSSSSSSSSSSASSKDSVMTVIPAPRNKGAKWFMRHFVGSRGKLSAV
ncbi:uncharacterized protein LOC122249185 [Penaeus japonicus]|uniref:uncharacterized protein LOC122249185 n=1 Tax=Penaeus japonicus TaxID=27405 RepID=UPI001C7136D5|nr:uncharacterized protein LOC122249185 [Penaeus japonicus]